MLAAQAAHREDVPKSAEDNKTALDKDLPHTERRERLQKALHVSASNGDLERIQSLLTGPARQYIDVNAPDEEGTAPLLYASCFGHAEVVRVLLKAGANVDQQDIQQWTPLIWATTNGHKDIAQLLLDNGASPEAKSTSGRTAFDFAAPDSDMSEYLQGNGYSIGNAGVADDFYQTGLSQDRFEEELAENELKRRMMMESAMNLEVDLGNLGLDEQPETPEEPEGEEQEFIWTRCLNDQMFVFQESELDRILDIVITNMTPQRSPSQKPVPANVIFLAARYAHYHGNSDLLSTLLVTAIEKMNDVVEKMQYDMTILAFWMSNSTLLLHYLKKDTGLAESTVESQAQLAELINEIFVLIIRDAERRMDKVLDISMLDHETIPGLEDVAFQDEWKFLRSRRKAEPEPAEKRFRPPSPRRRMKPSPRNITSLLSSTLFVLDLYDIHSVITTQILAQLIYWLGAELFNRIMSNRKYLARTKAMQVRMNVSVLEDWVLANSRQPEHYENGSTTMTGMATIDAARYHLAPVVQLLQFLQISTSVSDDLEALKNTIAQLPRLSPQQILHVVRYYRAEVGEKALPKPAQRYLNDRQRQVAERLRVKRQAVQTSRSAGAPSTPGRPSTESIVPPSPVVDQSVTNEAEEEEVPEHLLLDPAFMLPFTLPTSTDMLISYGAGIGGLNRERARKYVPTVPPEFLAKLDVGGRRAYSGSYTDTSIGAEGYENDD